MPSRRDVIRHSVAGCVALKLGAASLVFGKTKPALPQTQLRVLVLGGTGFIGPHFVRAALAKGHRVSVFSRGQRSAVLPSEVEQLVGDRNGDLRSIKNRDWDAVLDLATYGPIWVRTLGEALKGRVGHYTFISMNGLYDKPGSNSLTTESSPLMKYEWKEDPYTLTRHKGMEQYGALKLLCEQEAERQFPGKTFIPRPTIIFGPGELAVCSFWMARIERGGEMIAAGEASMPAQYIDVRDMADWSIRMAEAGGIGIYNVMGPKSPMSFGEMLAGMGRVLKRTPQVTWLPAAWLASRNEGRIWSTALIWPNTLTDLMRMSAERALKAGLTIRPMENTFADTFASYKGRSEADRARVFLGAETERGAPMTWPFYLAREREALDAWSIEKSTRNRATGT
jgi:2'-hydroxyisoflavone reductase